MNSVERCLIASLTAACKLLTEMSTNQILILTAARLHHQDASIPSVKYIRVNIVIDDSFKHVFEQPNVSSSIDAWPHYTSFSINIPASISVFAFTCADFTDRRETCWIRKSFTITGSFSGSGHTTGESRGEVELSRRWNGKYGHELTNSYIGVADVLANWQNVFRAINLATGNVANIECWYQSNCRLWVLEKNEVFQKC